MPANCMLSLEIPREFAARIDDLAAQAGYHIPQIYAEQLLQGAVMLLARPEGDALREIIMKEKTLAAED